MILIFWVYFMVFKNRVMEILQIHRKIIEMLGSSNNSKDKFKKYQLELASWKQRPGAAVTVYSRS